MCDPYSVAAIGLVASAAGTAMQVSQQQAYVNEQRNAAREQQELALQAWRQEQARQDQLAREADARFQQQLSRRSADDFEEAGAEMEGRVADTLANISAASTETGLLPGQRYASGDMQQAIAGRIAEGAREARERTAALARLAGYGAGATQRDWENKLFGADMGLLSSLSRGSLGVYGAERSLPARDVLPPDNSLAAILSGAGNLALQYGGRNWNVGSGGGVKGPAVKPAPII